VKNSGDKIEEGKRRGENKEKQEEARA